MGEAQEAAGVVALGGTTAELAPLVRAAGWRIGAPADVLLVDARAHRDAIAVCDAEALAQSAALLALIGDASDAVAAYEAGATHVLAGPVDAASLSTALRFAARHTRRVRGMGRSRRAGEEQQGAVERFLATLPRDAAASVAAVAMTRFDAVNAAYGRGAGDVLLQETERRIVASVPCEAVVERGAGARFLVALHAAPAAAAETIGAIEASLARRFAVGDVEASLGVRIGLAHRGPAEGPAALVDRAREALVAAVAADGAGVRVAPDPGAAPALRLAADLHRAIDRGEIDILFQPQVSLHDGAIVGVEALARWEHPLHGALGAETLFAAAARADLGLVLSEHIHRLALTRAAVWPEPIDRLRVAVNVTAADLARHDFAERFLALIATCGIAPQRITAEVTETGLVDDLATAGGRLAMLRAAGVRVAIDDFGTGYSSLAYLAALPLDYLKIDRSLLTDIATSPRVRAVVRGIVRIAADLQLRTIAEGVEDATQRDLLAQEGCDIYQGFLCAGPLDEAALARLVTG